MMEKHTKACLHALAFAISALLLAFINHHAPSTPNNNSFPEVISGALAIMSLIGTLISVCAMAVYFDD